MLVCLLIGLFIDLTDSADLSKNFSWQVQVSNQISISFLSIY